MAQWLNVVAKLRELLALVAALVEWFASRGEEPPEPLKSLSLLAAQLPDDVSDAAKSSKPDDDNPENMRF